jgi:hypothetical protein
MSFIVELLSSFHYNGVMILYRTAMALTPAGRGGKPPAKQEGREYENKKETYPMLR